MIVDILEIAAWVISAGLGGWMLFDAIGVSRSYDEELPTTSVGRAPTSCSIQPRHRRWRPAGGFDPGRRLARCVSAVGGEGQARERRALSFLGPLHIWGLGVGIVLVGEYMGCNFAVARGGMFGALIALLRRGHPLHLRRHDRLERSRPPWPPPAGSTPRPST